METRANYVMVGSFVLVILVGIFVAILWLAHAQFNQRFTYYDVFFTGSVTGLSVAAPVNLNGVAIGRVTEIRLDPVNPDQVRVTVEGSGNANVATGEPASRRLSGVPSALTTTASTGFSDASRSNASRTAAATSSAPATTGGTKSAITASMPGSRSR